LNLFSFKYKNVNNIRRIKIKTIALLKQAKERNKTLDPILVSMSYGYSDMYNLERMPIHIWFVRKIRDLNEQDSLLDNMILLRERIQKLSCDECDTDLFAIETYIGEGKKAVFIIYNEKEKDFVLSIIDELIRIEKSYIDNSIL